MYLPFSLFLAEGKAGCLHMSYDHDVHHVQIDNTQMKNRMKKNLTQPRVACTILHDMTEYPISTA